MKNYSRTVAGKGKTAFRTGDWWRSRKNISVRNIKSVHLGKSRLPNNFAKRLFRGLPRFKSK